MPPLDSVEPNGHLCLKSVNCWVKIYHSHCVTFFTGADRLDTVMTVCICIQIMIDYISFIDCAILCMGTSCNYHPKYC